MTRRAQVRRSVGASLGRPLRTPGAELLDVAAGVSVGEAVRELEARQEVVYAEPNFTFAEDAVPNDPLFGNQWGLQNLVGADIDAARAWDVTRGDPNVLVAVADAGVDLGHQDFGGGVGAGGNVYLNPGESGGGKEHNGVDDDGNGYADDVSGYDFHNLIPNPYDFSGHGTHAAGVAFARGDDGTGLTGVAQRVSMMSIKVRDEDFISTSVGVAEGFRYAGREGVRVVSASMGSPNSANLVDDAIRASPNTLFVFTAGNDARDVDASPSGRFPCTSTAPNVLCVAATDGSDSLAGFSNWGRDSVDLGAPGVDILGPQPTKVIAYSEDFSQALEGRWTTGGGPRTWERVSSDGTLYQLHSYPAGRSGTPSSAEPVAADNWIEMDHGFDLRGRSGCRLRYFLNSRAREGQTFTVQAAAGAGPWVTVGSPPRGWSDFRAEDLSRFDGQDDVRLRFRLAGTTFRLGDGAELAQLRIQCLTLGADARAHGSGTSFAVPHVSGAAALVAAHRPAASALELKAAILAGVDPAPSLAGRTVSGGRLNAYGALLGHRAPPRPARSTPSSAATTPLPAAVSRTPPRCVLRPIRGQRLRTVAARGYRVILRCKGRVSFRARIAVSGRAARRLGLRGRPQTLAHARGRAGAQRSIVLRFGPRTRRRLARARKLSASMFVAVRTPGAPSRSLSRRVGLRR